MSDITSLPSDFRRKYLFAILRHIFYGALIYVGGILVVQQLRGPMSVLEMIAAAKFMSLCSVIIVNGNILAAPGSGTRPVKFLNGLFLTICFALLLMLLVKIFGGKVSQVVQPSFFLGPLEWVQSNLFWITAFPIVAYFGLDLLVYFRSKSVPSSRMTAARYIVVADIPTVIPLVATIAFVLLFRNSMNANSSEHVEIFIGGCVTIIILSSAILAKTVDFYQVNLLGGYHD